MGTEPSAPARPDEAPSQRRVERRWLPALAVLGVIAVLTVGSRGVSEALSDTPGEAIDLSEAVRVTPVAGWTVEGPTKGDGYTTALLTHGTVAMQVIAAPGVRPPFEVLDAYVGQNPRDRPRPALRRAARGRHDRRAAGSEGRLLRHHRAGRRGGGRGGDRDHALGHRGGLRRRGSAGRPGVRGGGRRRHDPNRGAPMSATVRHAHLHHTSLWQPREPAFWIFVTFVVYGAWRMASVLTDLSTASRSGWALALAPARALHGARLRVDLPARSLRAGTAAVGLGGVRVGRSRRHGALDRRGRLGPAHRAGRRAALRAAMGAGESPRRSSRRRSRAPASCSCT